MGRFKVIVLTCLLCTSIVTVAIGQDAPGPGREDVNGRIIAQQLTDGQGYTVLHVWGAHYEMGYAHGYLMAEWVSLSLQEMMTAFCTWWPYIRARVAGWTFLPEVSEDEFQGLLDGVRAVYPEFDGDVIDLKAACTYGDWGYAFGCRSTCCWDEWVEPPFTTLSARKLQFYTLPSIMTQQWHHVICAREPHDGSPQWVNFGFPGYVTAVTSVNEYGTASSLHDWYSSMGPDHPAALPRTMAPRYALTMELGPDPMTHVQTVFDELSNYDVATGGFLNYYVPDGGAGVIKTSKSQGFYDYRVPQIEWMNGHVISTNNSDIDGKSGIEPWVSYYDTLDPGLGILATMEGLWETAYQEYDMHILEAGFRGPEDMTFWFTGRLQTGMLERLEFEWQDLFSDPSSVPLDPGPGRADMWPTARPLPAFPNPAGGVSAWRGITIPVQLCSNQFPFDLRMTVHDLSGRQVQLLSPIGFETGVGEAQEDVLFFHWDGKDGDGHGMPAGIYMYDVKCSRNSVAENQDRHRTGGRLVWMGR